MHNWKTTLSALVSAIALFVTLNADLFPDGALIVRFSSFVTIGGLVSFGIAARDK